MKGRWIYILLSIIVLIALALLWVYEKGPYTLFHQDGCQRLNADDTMVLLAKQEPTIIDVREKEEFIVSHIDQAIRFEPEMIKALDPKEPILLYCTASVRSNSLAKELIDLGFSKVYELKGGLIHWKNKGYKVVNKKGKHTDSLHTYSASFAPFLKNGIAVY